VAKKWQAFRIMGPGYTNGKPLEKWDVAIIMASL